ncbi:efflux RND transporter periplasmic adaptor subunit [Actinoplanes sp. HUAS TT8]|uniref:efflux RND transporter periplasmic adaptor subunit n=1 Tax=Actinoplanes sp. HUAS TT8 TaxID=3447453 RepID=UPI003F5248F0
MPSEKPPSRRRLAFSVALVLAAAATGGALWSVRRGGAAPAADASIPVRTVAVVRTDMTATESLTGTLGYGRSRPVKGAKDGIVTWLPQPGTPIRRGGQVFRVDDRPVPLFYGAMPLYRPLTEIGTVGRDVRIVAANLEALGYPVGRQPGAGETITRPTPTPSPSASAPVEKPATKRVTVGKGEGVLTSSLMAAIKKWQRDAGLPVLGSLTVGDVVVLPGAVRVEAVTAQPGDAAIAPLMSVTPTAKVVTVPAEVTAAVTIQRGDQVTVVLPGDKSATGEVSAVAAAAVEEGAGPSDTPKRSITVTVDDDKALAGLDSAKVRVDFGGESHHDVLAVPVGALVALREGGYAVELAAGNRLVAVTTGMFATGLVEITGDGLAAGDMVVTSS